MKKLFKLVIIALMIISISGCSKKKPKDYYDILKENGYQILITYDNKHLYNENLDCYNEEGKEIDAVRLVKKPGKNPVYLLFNEENEQSMRIHFDKDTKELLLFAFHNDDASYYIDFKEKTRFASVLTENGSKVDSCRVNYEGKTDGTKCSSKYVKKADKAKKEYEGMLESLEIEEENLIDIFTWFSQEKFPIIKKELTNVYNEQEPLSNKEIIDTFEENRFWLKKDADGTLNFCYINSSIETDNMTFTGLLNNNSELIGVVFLYNLYYDSFIYEPGMIYCYYVDQEYSRVFSNDGKKVYNLDFELSVGEEECDKEFIETANTLSFVFRDTLDDLGITLEELISFFKTYKD